MAAVAKKKKPWILFSRIPTSRRYGPRTDGGFLVLAAKHVCLSWGPDAFILQQLQETCLFLLFLFLGPRQRVLHRGVPLRQVKAFQVWK